MPRRTLAYRLAMRELFGSRPGAAANQSRQLYDALTPNTVISHCDVPDAHICKFSPDGQYLVCFGSAFQQLVVYRFTGHAQALCCLEQQQQRNTSIETSAEQPSDGPHTQQQQQQQQQDGYGSGVPAAANSLELVPSGLATTEPQHGGDGGPGFRRIPSLTSLMRSGVAAAAGQPSQFKHFFQLVHRTNVCGGGSTLAKDVALFPLSHACGDLPLVLLASHTSLMDPTRTQQQQQQQQNGAAGGPQPRLPPAPVRVVPYVELTTFHLLNLETGEQLDELTLQHDWVPLVGGLGVSLMGDLVAITAVRSQQVLLVQVKRSGQLVQVLQLGPWCWEDDELVVAQADEAERRWQQQQRRRQEQELLPSLPSPPALEHLGMGRGSAIKRPRPEEPSSPLAGPANGAHLAFLPLAGPPPAPAHQHQANGPASSTVLLPPTLRRRSHQHNALLQPAGRAPTQAPTGSGAPPQHVAVASAAGVPPPTPPIGGTMLSLVLLPPGDQHPQPQHRTAHQDHVTQAPADGASHTAPVAEQAPAGLLGGWQGGGQGSGCPAPSLLGGLRQRLLAHHYWSCLQAARAGSAPSRTSRAAARRAALRSFYADFEALASLVVWRAQLITPDLILLDLGTPTGASDLPAQQPAVLPAAGLGAAPAAGGAGAGGGGLSGPQQSQYIAVYGWREAKVYAFLASTSDAAVEVLLKYTPLLGADAGMSTWDRFSHTGKHIQVCQDLLAALLPHHAAPGSDAEPASTAASRTAAAAAATAEGHTEGGAGTALVPWSAAGRAPAPAQAGLGRAVARGSMGSMLERPTDRLLTVKRVLTLLLGGCQAVSSSPLVDCRLFSYDEKLLLPLTRVRPVPDQPVRFYAASRPKQVAFKLEPGALDTGTAVQPAGRLMRQLMLPLFHPVVPFVMLVGSTVMGPQVSLALHLRL